jgi:hypothetical protein
MNEIRGKMVESVKNGRNMKVILLTQIAQKRALQQQIKENETKYEDEVLCYMLESKLHLEANRVRQTESTTIIRSRIREVG